MSDSNTEDETESTDIETLADVHCILATEERADPRYGEATVAVFDPDVLTEWVYDELLDALRADGYDLVAFGTTSEADVELMGLGEDEAETALHAPKGVFVYRGVTE